MRKIHGPSPREGMEFKASTFFFRAHAGPWLLAQIWGRLAVVCGFWLEFFWSNWKQIKFTWQALERFKVALRRPELGRPEFLCL